MKLGKTSDIKKYNKEYRESHREEARLRQRIYWEKNRDIILERQKKYRELNKEKISIQNQDRKSKNVANTIYTKAKYRAKQKNIPFSIEIEDILIPDVCPVLGIPLFFSRGHENKKHAYSIDRIIPELGYIKGNIQVLSELANRMKTNATKEELLKFSAWIQKIYGE